MRPALTQDEIFAASEMSRHDFYFFSRWMFLQRKGYTWRRAEHHKAITDALMRVYEGEIKRLIINIPPRYSKTELAVVNFIAWAMGRNPDSEFIHTSYSAALASNNSGQTKSLMQHEAYASIFPGAVLSNDAQHHWKTTRGGVMYAAGTGGTLTGFGAGKDREGFGGAIIIDDPHKADEAKSDVMRAGVLDWFQTTLESRKNSRDTPIVLIMQRLHESDLSGWLLGEKPGVEPGGNGEVWQHLCLEALRPDGTALWPEKHDVETLRRMERAAPYTFSGQYQQRPAPLEGGIFKPGRIEVIPAVPIGPIRWVRGWDFGATVDGDPTASIKIGRLADGRFLIADCTCDRLGPDDRDALLKNAAKSDGVLTHISIPQDPGQAGKTQVQYLTKELAGFRVHSSPESGDKVTRAEPVAAQVNVGNVLMVAAPWNEQLKAEMAMFPNATHDDRVDALSRAFAYLIGRFAMRIDDDALASV